MDCSQVYLSQKTINPYNNLRVARNKLIPKSFFYRGISFSFLSDRRYRIYIPNIVSKLLSYFEIADRYGQVYFAT